MTYRGKPECPACPVCQTVVLRPTGASSVCPRGHDIPASMLIINASFNEVVIQLSKGISAAEALENMKRANK